MNMVSSRLFHSLAAAFVLLSAGFLHPSAAGGADSHHGLVQHTRRTVDRYTFEEFDRLVKERGMVSEFSPYEFRMKKNILCEMKG